MKKTKLPELPKEVESVVTATGLPNVTTTGAGIEVSVNGTQTVSRPKPGHIELEFGREDLNQLKGKLNEVVDYINTL